MPRQKTKSFYTCKNCGRFPVWAGNPSFGDVCECETYIPANAEEVATRAVNAALNVLKQSRPFRWGIDGLRDEFPEAYAKMFDEVRDAVMKEMYRDE